MLDVRPHGAFQAAHAEVRGFLERAPVVPIVVLDAIAGDDRASAIFPAMATASLSLSFALARINSSDGSIFLWECAISGEAVTCGAVRFESADRGETAQPAAASRLSRAAQVFFIFAERQR